MAITQHLGFPFDLTPASLAQPLQALGADLSCLGRGDSVARRLHAQIATPRVMQVTVSAHPAPSHARFRIERNIPF